MLVSIPICEPIFLINDNLGNGLTIRLDIDSKGKNCEIYFSESLFGKIQNPKISLRIPSKKYQTNRKPNAKADRFTKIPMNKQKVKKPVSFTKKARR